MPLTMPVYVLLLGWVVPYYLAITAVNIESLPQIAQNVEQLTMTAHVYFNCRWLYKYT